MHKSNPTVFEWCASPIVYYQTEEFEELKKILPEMEKGPKVQVFNEYIERVLPEIKSIAEEKEEASGSWDLLNTLFLSMVQRYIQFNAFFLTQ